MCAVLPLFVNLNHAYLGTTLCESSSKFPSSVISSVSRLSGQEGRGSGRHTLLLCCCMGTGPRDRRAGIAAWSAANTTSRPCALDIGQQDSRFTQRVPLRQVDPEGTIDLMARSKFVWSPPGIGFTTFRDVESLYAGAVPVMRADEHRGWAPYRDSVFTEEVPSVFVGGRLPELNCQGKRCGAVADWSRVSRDLLEREWARIEKRDRDGPAYDLKTMYWPYWLERVTRHMVGGE